MNPFPIPAPTSVGRARGTRIRLRVHRRLKASDPRSWNLVLASAGTGVPVRMVLDSPGLLTAAVEDLEWRLALADLRAGRPHRWQRSKMAAWSAEQERLEDRRRRIAEFAAEAVSAM
ncbi:MAG: hypothetical protein AUG49_14905 [Catenulispora sp. 13_1_20CM_3_70_7]|nr:MAG: hypothetical protein AUG49_14905 [Catenulispora sp. 13_1_20CM_3_70_7]